MCGYFLEMTATLTQVMLIRGHDHVECRQGSCCRSRTASVSAGKISNKQRADAPDAGIGRRAFLSAATAGMLTAWWPALRVSPSSAQATCAPPPNFPSTIALYQEAYENWSQEIRISSLWTCAPQNPSEVRSRWWSGRVTTITRCARKAGCTTGHLSPWRQARRVPPMSCWSTPPNTSPPIPSTQPPMTVTAQTGITMEALLTALEQAGLGVTATPAPGDLTLGGVLAIDGHGTAVPATGSQSPRATPMDR